MSTARTSASNTNTSLASQSSVTNLSIADDKKKHKSVHSLKADEITEFEGSSPSGKKKKSTSKKIQNAILNRRKFVVFGLALLIVVLLCGLVASVILNCLKKSGEIETTDNTTAYESYLNYQRAKLGNLQKQYERIEIHYGGKNNEENRYIPPCNTTGCVTVGRHILLALNTSADPCEDFYEFACGNWAKNSLIPDEEDRTNTDIEYKKKMKYALSIIRNTDYPSALRKADDYYKLCEKVARNGKSESDAMERLIRDVVNIIGGYPPIGKPFKTSFDITRILGLLSRKMIFIIAQWQMDYYRHGSQGYLRLRSIYEVDGSKTNFGMDTKFGEASELIALSFKTKIKSSVGQEYLNVALKIHKELSEAALGGGSDRLLYKKISEFNTRIELSRMFSYVIFDGHSLNLEEDTQIAINSDEFYTLGTYDDILHKYDPDYVRVFIAMAAVRKIIGLSSLNNCYKQVLQDFSTVFNYVYATNITTAEEKQYLDHFFEHFRNSAKEKLGGNQWMDGEISKNIAYTKLKELVPCLLYDSRILNPAFVDETYSKVEFTKRDDFFSAREKLSMQEFFNFAKTAYQPMDRHSFCIASFLRNPDANALYFYNVNALVYAAGYLQEHRFAMDFPLSYVYASIGSTLGHELIHGFDSIGRSFNKLGIAQEWPKETLDEYDRRAQCFKDQYNNFKLSQYNVKGNGEQTFNENLADIEGLDVAWRAYRHWIVFNGEPAPVPGLEQLTADQIFFLGFAQTRCAVMKKTTLYQKAKTSSHSLPTFRVWGPATNQKEFAEAFHCPLGSKHNPPNNQRCRMW